MNDDPRVTMADARSLGYCVRGMRVFADIYKLDWDAFKREGIPVGVFEATGDAMAIKAAAQARARASASGSMTVPGG